MAGELNADGGSQFPSQAVSDSVKRSKEYGLKVANAIQNEWWRQDDGLGGGGNSSSHGDYQQNRYEYHRLRLYARGEQSTSKYQDEFAINGDLSYLNLDWKPVPIVPKFVDIVVNGMQDRLFSIKAQAQDPIATDKRSKFVEQVQEDMNSRDFTEGVREALGIDISNVPKEDLPDTAEELDLYMNIGYKQGIEIAMEQGIDNIFMQNKYPEIKRQIDRDLVVLGIGAAKHTFNNTDGIKLEWVDPADLVYSYTEDPTFGDCYYFGEIKRVRANELKKEFPDLTNAELDEIVKKGSIWDNYFNSGYYEREDTNDRNTVSILYFNWKSWKQNVHKVKKTATGADKALKKDDTFDPPKDKRAGFEKVAVAQETVYEGAYVLGTEMLLKWQEATNIVRPDSNTNKVMMNYVVNAPKLYKGRPESLVSRMTTYADLIQLQHLKLQQVIQRMTPSGVYLNADGLVEIDLGNGTSYNPQEALNMFFQTGSVIGRSLTTDGDQNPGAIPVQPLPGTGGEQIGQLIDAYNFYLNMIRDTTGLNEARDGSDPDPYALVGVQKLAAANSNTATRHILHGCVTMTEELARGITQRFKDVLEFHPKKKALIGSIGRFSVGSLQELDKLHHHDFGIFLELAPDEEEKALVEQNLQQALAKDQIGLEDAIDVRGVKNLKLANELLKIRKKKKIEMDQMLEERKIKLQGEQITQQTQAAELAKGQSEQMKSEAKGSLSQLENELAIKKEEILAQTKKELMRYEFELNKELKQMEIDAAERLADKQMKAAKAEVKSGPPTSGAPIKSFESSNDTLGAISTEQFAPK